VARPASYTRLSPAACYNSEVSTSLTLHELSGRYAVCRLPSGSSVPAWATSGALWTITGTADELSVLCDETSVPQELLAESPANFRYQGGWVAFKLLGPFEFSLTGILTAVLDPLRDAGVGIFAISTYDTDYVLVLDEHRSRTIDTLRSAGHQIIN
jgi:uncharacterized protein